VTGEHEELSDLKIKELYGKHCIYVALPGPLYKMFYVEKVNSAFHGL
jgi:hypothetical protein